MIRPLPQNAALPHWASYSSRLGGLALWVALLSGCKELPTPKHDTPPPPAVLVQTAPPPSLEKSYCAWYGDAWEGVLYFGESAFWSAMRAAGGDPRADLRREGPRPIGRFDLRAERMLPALVASPDTSVPTHAGVWDVLAHPNGRLYYTTYFEESGYVELSTGRAVALGQLGVGLNELALGPGGSILATRYGGGAGGGGSVVQFDPDGTLLSEWPLAGPAGWKVAPKSLAYDPTRRAVWLTTDLLPDAEKEKVRQDGRVLDLAGQELVRFELPELQFVTFDAAGTGYLVERAGTQLTLRIVRPDETGPLATAGRRILLDDHFAATADFAQNIRLAQDGRVVITRWSGHVHVVDLAAPSGREVRTVELPRPADGFYYTAVLEGAHLCATLCAGVTVVCTAAP
jgi:hypothetical protein